MASVTARTANWRLFGGSALVIGGLLWLAFQLIGNQLWVLTLAYVVLAAGLVILAFGQSGGNGAVGKNVLGKVALVVYAAGWALLGLATIVALPAGAAVLAGLFIIGGGLVSAWAVYKERVAKGAARWILFLPAGVGAIWALQLLGLAFGFPLLGSLVAVLFIVAGVLYLLNDRKLG